MGLRGIWSAAVRCALGALFLAGAAQARAANYPTGTVRLVIGYAAGGGTDILARLIAEKLSEKWGHPVIVDNRPGADGSLAANYVAHAAPDGATIILITTNHTVPPTGYTLNYDPLLSFAPVIEVAYIPDLLVVNPALPANSLPQLIALAKAMPSKLNFASSGTGTAQYMDMQLLQRLAGVNIVNVTYKGSGPTMAALLSGEVQMGFTPVSPVLELVRSGKLKALVISGNTRSPLLPDVPAITEVFTVNGFEGSSTWYGIVAPAGTPADIVKTLHDDIADVMEEPDTQQRLQQQGFVTVDSTSDGFRQTIADELAKWSGLMKTVGDNK